MSLQDDLAAAGEAVSAPQRSTSRLSTSCTDCVDLHRLREDVGRIGTDLELLRESQSGGEGGGQAHKTEPDPTSGRGGEYDPAFWADTDGDDVGVSRPSH